MIEVPLRAAAYRAVTSPLRMMPDFLVLGTARGGTTAFYHYLTRHPALGEAVIKEVHYFDWNFAKGPLWYRAHFPTERHKRHMEAELGQRFLTGEATPAYFYNPVVPPRVARTVPQAKLIVLLRNPVERAFSHYRLCSQNRTDLRPFGTALDEEEQQIREELEAFSQAAAARSPLRSYLAQGLYAEHLQRWLRSFPREQLLILRSEDYFTQPDAVLREALAFLGVSAESLPENIAYDHFDKYTSSTTVAGQALDPALRERLVAYFAPHNERLYAFLGRDMGWS